MNVVRRHRRTILLVLGLVALGAITWGYLRRVGVVHETPAREGSHARDR